jgi:hypothetical protein
VRAGRGLRGLFRVPGGPAGGEKPAGFPLFLSERAAGDRQSALAGGEDPPGFHRCAPAGGPPPKGDEPLPFHGNGFRNFAQSAKLHTQTAMRFESAARSHHVASASPPRQVAFAGGEDTPGFHSYYIREIGGGSQGAALWRRRASCVAKPLGTQCGHKAVFRLPRAMPGWGQVV